MSFASGSRQQSRSTYSDDEEDDDPILKTLPVYYTPHYLSSLTLLQYPDRQPRPETPHPLLPPSLRPDADPRPDPARSKISARYKPQSQHLEVEVPIERHPERWNDDDAKQYATGVIEEKDKEAEREQAGKKKKRRGAEDEEERRRVQEEKESRRLDKMTYSSISVPDVTNYLVGIVKDGAF